MQEAWGKKVVPGASKIYSEAAICGPLVFVAGQASIDLETQQAVPGTIEAQTRRTLENLKEVLRRAGSSLDNVLKVLLMVESLDDFDAINRVYLEYFPSNPPARSTVETRLPGGVRVEMEAVAVRNREGDRS
jgi:2-iminobutanoate/2-iminopropanoate deaminase